MKKITIDDDCRHLSQSHITVGYIGENKTEQIEFKIPEKYKNYGKKICFEANGKTFQKLFDNVTDNTVTFTRDMTKYDELYATVVFFKTNDDDEIVAKTSLLHILIEGAVNCPDDVSPDDPKVIILDKLINDVTNLNNEITLSEKERTNNESQRIENENHRIANETQREEYMENLKSSVENGDFNGKDATINGFNTLNIVAGTNIDLKQKNETLEINNTYQYNDSDLVKEIDDINNNLKNYSLITETGNKLDLTIDSKTYIMTLKLKDKDDNVLSTGSVDLPIESMIINVTYNNDNEKLTFTLQNGSVIDVPLDSLISGLVNEIDLKNILKDYAKTTDVPTKVSELANDSNYVKNTDYAEENKAGVIKTNIPFYATAVTSDGILYATPRTLEQYAALNNTGIISKGTLENVIVGKNLETANNKVNFVNENSTDKQYPSAKCTYEIKNNLDRLKDNVLEVGEASNTYIHVEDSSLNELKELEVEGVCEQETTTGKNLLPNKIQSKTVNGITCTNNNDGTITLNGTTTAKTYLTPSSKDFISLSLDGNYTFSANTYNNISYALYHGSAELFFWNTTSDKTFSATGSFDNVRPQINIESGITLNNVIVKFQLEKGSTATEYEPYTGQARPSPDYPQEIETITGSLKLTSCGKNFLTNQYQKNSTIKVNGISFRINNDNSVTVNGTATENAIIYPIAVENAFTLFPGTYTFSGCPAGGGSTKYKQDILTLNNAVIITDYGNQTYSRVLSTNTALIMSRIVIYKGFTANNLVFKPMLEISSAPSAYEEHIQSQININLPEGEFIGKIDDTYKDTLKVVYKEDGKHHLILNKIISKTVLNGTQPISYSKVINDDKFVAQFNIGTAIKSSSTMISDKFIYMSNGWASNSENISTGGSNNNLLQMKILQSRLEEISSNGLTNWLSTHPVEVYYALENPYEVDLGIVDMPLSYSGVTNIFTDSDLLPKINAKYYKDFKLSIKNYINSYIDNKLNELQSTANDVATADNTQSDENQNNDLS